MNFEFRQQPLKPKAIILAILISIVSGAAIILCAGHNPIEVYSKMISGAFGSQFAIASTLRWTTPLMFTGAAAAFAFRGGMFNIGVEGQMYIGAFFAAWVGFTFQTLPAIVLIPLCLIAGAVGGMLWVLLPAVMRVRFGASEMVTTLMLNYVAMLLTDYLVKYHFMAGGIYGPSLVTKEISTAARLPQLWPPLQAHSGIFLGLLTILVFSIIIKKTRLGYEIHITGINPNFAFYGGVNVNKVRMSVMFISAAIAGIGGAVEVMGFLYKFMSRFSPDFGFDGLVVALLGANSPAGVLISSFFLGAVKAGALTVERYTSVSRSLAMIIQGIIVTFISCKELGNISFFKKRGALAQQKSLFQTIKNKFSRVKEG